MNTIQHKGVRVRVLAMSIYMGVRLGTYSDNWHFKDTVKTKFGYHYIWYIGLFQP